jgi:hypothetical protein
MSGCIEDAGDNNENGGRNKEQRDTRQVKPSACSVYAPQMEVDKNQ